MKEEMKTKLMPLYEEMLSKFEGKGQLTTFCARWEKNFPQEKGKGILFVGRVVRKGTENTTIGIENLFSDTHKNRILQPDYSISWVESNSRVKHKKGDYNVNRSAFWQVIKGVSQKIYGKNNEWYSHIAWTNLYKVSPTVGNPTTHQEKIQLPYCVKILKAEIEVLQPKFVIFLTSRREEYNGFIKENYGTLEKLDIKKWKNDKYETKLYKVNNDLYFVKSYHPQGKPIQQHIDIIYDLIKDKLSE